MKASNTINSLFTPFAEKMNKNCPLSEYPRPQLVRDSYLCLNGLWEYAITDTSAIPAEFDGQILVPFSPEAPLSGVKRTLLPTQTLWYRRALKLPEGFLKERLILHFGAVDQSCTLYINGIEAGSHSSGYLPFSFDITNLYCDGCTLLLKVTDVSDTSYHAVGKQRFKRGGIWYSPQSGIWQTVWCESVSKNYINALKITSLYDEGAISICADTSMPMMLEATVKDGEKVVAAVSFSSECPITIPLADIKSWSPESPFLYSLIVSGESDRVESYFGMRKFSVQRHTDGFMRLFLNNRPYFHNGLLDQGYWPDGLYTPASDEALVGDISSMKEMGYNMLRKHIKIEPLRWYYHCDRLGMIVWQDMVSGGRPVSLPFAALLPMLGIHIKDRHYRLLGRTSKKGRSEFLEECDKTIEHLYNCTCIGVWVPFNEGWGQFDAKAVFDRITALDPTRTVDHASGWHDQKAGQLKSLHIYFKPIALKPDSRAIVLSEFGGYNLRIEGHCFDERDYGYKRFNNKDELTVAMQDLYANQVVPAIAQGLCAAIYTQVSDVEDELNGIFTYDRKIQKIDSDALLTIFAKMSNF